MLLLILSNQVFSAENNENQQTPQVNQTQEGTAENTQPASENQEVPKKSKKYTGDLLLALVLSSLLYPMNLIQVNIKLSLKLCLRLT